MIIRFNEIKTDRSEARDVSLFGAFGADRTVEFRIAIECDDDGFCADSAAMVIHADGWNSGKTEYKKLPLEPADECEYSIVLNFADLLEMYSLDGEGLFYYHYELHAEDTVVYLGGEKPEELTVLDNAYYGERQLLVHRADYRTSSSFTEGLIYHIFVDRFKSSGKFPVCDNAVLDKDWDGGIPQYGEYPGAEVSNNVFFGGDLCGIADEIDYIASLGVKTIYLSPVFEAYSNHKYDTGDYLHVDPMFGGDEALRQLCECAKERGINVILDGVFNHTGDDSVYFNKRGTYKDSVGAYQSEESEYYPWYMFREYPDEYECWWGVKILPRVDSSNEKYRGFICGEVIDKWMKAGVSGWRLDVADELSEDFLVDLRSAVKEKNPDGVIIGEVWEDASDKVSYGYRRSYLRGRQLDSVMNYPLRNAVIEYVKNGNCDLLRQYTEGTYRRYPKCSSDNLMNFLGTHDTERIFTILSGQNYSDKTNEELSTLCLSDKEKETAAKRLRLAFSIIGGLPGVPCVFYGDEIGMEGYRDPFCRKPYPWKKSADDTMAQTLLSHYRTIGNIRRDNEVFRDGLFRLLEISPDYIVYSREPYSGGERIIVCACRCGTVSIEFSEKVRSLTDGKNAKKTSIPANEAKYFVVSAECSVRVTHKNK